MTVKIFSIRTVAAALAVTSATLLASCSSNDNSATASPVFAPTGIQSAGRIPLAASNFGLVADPFNVIGSDGTNADDERRQRDRRNDRAEHMRCADLERDLAVASATLMALQALPREGGNIQMVALAQARLDRLTAAQC